VEGKLVINDPIPAGAGHGVFRWFWHVLGPEKGAEYIRALRAQAGAVDRDQRRQVEWIARGRYPVLLAPSDGVLGQLQEEGVQVGIVPEFKRHGTLINSSFGNVMLVNQAPHPNAARVFINWLLTKDGQSAYSTAMGQPSGRLDVPRDHLPPEVIPRPDVVYYNSALEENAISSPELQTLLREVFGS
jgi:iron(III) transport system substrate-binding protein